MSNSPPQRFFNRRHAVAGFQVLAGVLGLLAWIFVGTDLAAAGRVQSISAVMTLAAVACCLAVAAVARQVAAGVSAALGASVLGSASLCAIWLLAAVQAGMKQPALWMALAFGLLAVAFILMLRRLRGTRPQAA